MIAALGRDNITRIAVQDDAGAPVNLDTLGATQVSVVVCGPLYSASVDATWSAAVVEVVLGDLALPVGVYQAKLVYYSPTNPDGQVLAGPGFDTQISLQVVC